MDSYFSWLFIKIKPSYRETSGIPGVLSVIYYVLFDTNVSTLRSFLELIITILLLIYAGYYTPFFFENTLGILWQGQNPALIGDFFLRYLIIILVFAVLAHKSLARYLSGIGQRIQLFFILIILAFCTYLTTIVAWFVIDVGLLIVSIPFHIISFEKTKGLSSHIDRMCFLIYDIEAVIFILVAVISLVMPIVNIIRNLIYQKEKKQ